MKAKNLFILSLAFFLFESKAFPQFQAGVVNSISVETPSTVEDRIILRGKGLPSGDLIQIRRLNLPIGADAKELQWEMVLQNTDILPAFLSGLNAGQITIGQPTSVIQSAQVVVQNVNSQGVLLPSVRVSVKIKPEYFADKPNNYVASVDVQENDQVEFLIRRDVADPELSFLQDKAQFQASPNSQDNLPVPVLQVSLVGYDGAKSLLESEATKLSIYLNQQRRDELNKRFGIQFFINNVSLNKDQILKKTFIYYRFSETNPKQRFLKEALYLAKIIPNESVVRPMLDQDKKPGVAIEIFVGKDLR